MNRAAPTPTARLLPPTLFSPPQTHTHTLAHAAKFACPVTGLEFNGKTRFLVHRVSGQVISERALKEVSRAAPAAGGSGGGVGSLCA